jgi:hypothetical protein
MCTSTLRQLSNARVYGELGMPITALARAKIARVKFGVSNHGEPIAQELKGTCLTFRSESANNPRNRTGLGLSLPSSTANVEAPGGKPPLECIDEMVIFVAHIIVLR